jgi:hypothetical protein
MRNILSGKTLAAVALLFSCATASAGNYATISPDAPMTLIQDSTRSRTDDRQPRPQRYVCVVQPAQSDNRSRPYVCRAEAGRVGGTCRCNNVTGSGRLDLDD